MKDQINNIRKQDYYRCDEGKDGMGKSRAALVDRKTGELMQAKYAWVKAILKFVAINSKLRSHPGIQVTCKVHAESVAESAMPAGLGPACSGLDEFGAKSLRRPFVGLTTACLIKFKT